ncbi:MAG: hypothetical protein KC425_07730 [Anaerolineales bacterium]|nr:hypothetical protein [Anaerolineales bacterium]
MARLRLLSGLILLLLVAGCRAAAPDAGAPVDGDPVATLTPDGDTAVSTTPDSRFDCTAVADLPAAECRALVAFYDATGGPAWQDAGGWLQTPAPCSWSGVSCADGHVDMLALFYNNLQGPLPAALADLARLRVLDLHNNALSGPIPPELGRLTGLQALDLSVNRLGGTVPAALGALPALQLLNLAHNQLGGALPAELGQLTGLRTLDLSHNLLSGALPAELANLAALESLRLTANQLEGAIPFGLGALPALAEVDLSFNRLTGTVPSALYEAPIHRLWGNSLDGTMRIAPGSAQAISFLGVEMTVDAALADSVWAEQVPAQPAVPGPGVVWAPQGHTVFTLVQDAGPQAHAPMGQYVPAEAQIHVYPTAGLNAEVQPAVTALRELLAARPDPAAYAVVQPDSGAAQPGLTMLPPSNAVPTLRAQAQYVSFAGGEGIRYLTQLSQGPVPVANQELFYTFQGLTADGAVYVAAYFPVALPALPDAPDLSSAAFATLMADYPGYLAEILALLNAQPALAFAPDLAALDALIGSISVAGLLPTAEIAAVWPEDGASVDGQPILQWTAVSGAARYELVVVDDDAFPPAVAISQVTTETQLPLAPPLAPGSYSWTVRALDAAGVVLAELNRAFFVKDALTPLAPAAGETVRPGVLLQWQPYAAAVRYQVILLDDDAYPPVVVLDELTTGTALAAPADLAAGSYSWTVWAFDEGGRLLAELASGFVVAP